MLFNIAEPSEILSSIAPINATLSHETHTIDGWRAAYRKELATARQQPDIAIFNSFVNSLLERASSGEAWAKRYKAIMDTFLSFDNVDEQNITEVLKGYRFPNSGKKVILEAKKRVCEPAFSWDQYFEEAEQQYETDFQSDPFLVIKDVGYKTRDLALSEFSDRFVALDLHVVRVTTRTGLFLHGYGSPQITTDVSKEDGYLFFHDLMLKLSRRTGWPSVGYSLGEIDRMLWYFGREICGSTPRCADCPIAKSCLTAQRKESGVAVSATGHHG
jgi:endonuclease III